jgi:hypothetical protein
VGYSDFGFRLDDYLQAISDGLRQQSYYPKPLLTLDIPKSSLSVRPGSVLAIDDAIVLFAITRLIAPPLDKKLPDGVYSWRVKPGNDKKELFHDHEIIRLPFLKSKTIARRIEIIEPWYTAWPEFIEDMQYAYEEEGYKYLVTTDIVSYFENIDLSLLRDLLLQELKGQPRVINFLLKILQHWAWPSIFGRPIPRGIPQGNGVSSFLGNFYLLPLDRAFERTGMDIKYFRYVDDVKVLAKDRKSAREALFLMNEELRGLHLNIQSAKTEIHEDDQIREELFDNRLEEVNKIIKDTQRKKVLVASTRTKYVAAIKRDLRPLWRGNPILKGKELRLFRRSVTAFSALQHSGLISRVLGQIEENPDSRLMKTAFNYLKSQYRIPRVARRLVHLLEPRQELFPYQKANFLFLLRYMRVVPDEAWAICKRSLRLSRSHWYVRQQAALLLSQKKLNKKELSGIKRLFELEKQCEVRRSMAQALTQLSPPEFTEFVQTLLFASDPGLQRLGRFYHALLYDAERAKSHLKSLFHELREDILIDRLHEVVAMAKSKDGPLRLMLKKNLVTFSKKARRPLLLSRMETILIQMV